MATHSDEAEHSAERPAATHIIGQPLAEAVLRAAVPELAARFHVLACNPCVRDNARPDDAGKKWHMRRIARHYGTGMAQCALFDGDERNVDLGDASLLVDGERFLGVRVCERHG